MTDKGLRILSLHRGAYALGDAATVSGLLCELVLRAGAHAVSVNHRLAPQHPAPTAVNDILTVQTTLLDSGVRTHLIVFAGESAGVRLVIALRVAARRRSRPLSAAAVIFSRAQVRLLRRHAPHARDSDQPRGANPHGRTMNAWFKPEGAVQARERTPAKGEAQAPMTTGPVARSAPIPTTMAARAFRVCGSTSAFGPKLKDQAMSILVIGSTGTIGTQVVAEIARRDVEVHALIHEAQAKPHDNVILVEGDTTDMDSMRKAMSGMTTLFLLNPVVADELNRALLMLDLAQEAGIQRVVYFSMFNADTFLDCPHACAKYAAELMIQKFRIPTTILRPNYFFQNDAPAAKTHQMPMPIGSLGTSMADARDIGEVAAIELIRRDRSPDPLPTEIIEIHGPDVITAQSAVRTWTEVLGKEVTYPGDDLRAFEKRFEKMAPNAIAYDVAGMFRGFQRDGMVAPDGASERIAAMLGRPMRTYRAFAEETAAHA